MSEHNGVRVLKFRTSYDTGKPIVYVLLAPRGESMQSTQTWHRVEKLRPPEQQKDDEGDSIAAMRARWEIIEPAYKAYLNEEEIPENGVPVGAWSILSEEQAKFLKAQGYDTVEAVSEVSEPVAMKWPWPSAKKLPAMAKEYLERKGADKLAEEKAELEERIRVMEEMLAEKQAEPAPKRRGRPPKAQVETEAA